MWRTRRVRVYTDEDSDINTVTAIWTKKKEERETWLTASDDILELLSAWYLHALTTWPGSSLPLWHRVDPAEATRQKLLLYFCHVPANRKTDNVSLFGQRCHADNDEANELGKSIQNMSFPRLEKKPETTTLLLRVQRWSRHQLPADRTLKTSIHYQITNTWHFNSFPPQTRPTLTPDPSQTPQYESWTTLIKPFLWPHACSGSLLPG